MGMAGMVVSSVANLVSDELPLSSMGKQGKWHGSTHMQGFRRDQRVAIAAVRAQHKINPKPPNGITTLKRLYSMQDLGLDGTRGRAILAIGRSGLAHFKACGRRRMLITSGVLLFQFGPRP
jgi:hypothetical protein